MTAPKPESWPADARAILHVDMDAFYASVEVHDRPELRGRPVIVGGSKDARGVVSAASYEAREFGVKSAMPLRVAGRRCPRGVFLPVRMERYLEVSRAVFAIFDRFTPLVEPLSVDEAFLDLTGTELLFGGPIATAHAIRAAISSELGLTASVGVAPNKFVAKIASDLEKPDALVVFAPGHVAEKLAPLSVKRMWGIGPRGAEALKRAGIKTFRDLAGAGAARLTPLLGRSADGFVALARGEDARSVTPSRGAKSVGHETTFSENVRDEETVHATLLALADQVGGRLRRQGLRARTVQLKVRYEPFDTLTRRVTLAAPTCTTHGIFDAVWDLFVRRTERVSRPVRLLGVSTSGFSSQGLLFLAESETTQLAVETAVDKVRGRFGRGALQRGSVLRSPPSAMQGDPAKSRRDWNGAEGSRRRNRGADGTGSQEHPEHP